MATGLQNGFSGKALLSAAEMGAAQGLTMGELGINPSSTGSPFESASLSFGKQVALAGLSNLQGQALMLATNQEKRFNWTDLELATANGAIQFVGAQVGTQLGNGSRFATNLFGNTIDIFAGNALASACPGVRFNLADTISQTLGSTVGQQIGGALMDAQMARLARQQQSKIDWLSPDGSNPFSDSSLRSQIAQYFDQQQVLLYDASNGSGNSSRMSQGAQRASNTSTSYASQSSSSDLLSTVAALQSVLTQDTGLVGRFGGAANDNSFVKLSSFRFFAQEKALPAQSVMMGFGLVDSGFFAQYSKTAFAPMAINGNETFTNSSTVTLYRSVNYDEFEQLSSTNEFAQGPNSMEGKFFAENYSDASQWGDIMNGQGNHIVVEVEVPNSAAQEMMRWPKLDGIGPARFATFDQLRNVKINLPELTINDDLAP